MHSTARGVSAALSGWRTRRRALWSGVRFPGRFIMVRQIPATFCVAAGLVVSSGAGSAAPVARSCTGSFAQAEPLGAFASADFLDRLYAEMGPARVAMTTKGLSVSGTYTTKAPDLTIWTYLGIYQPEK